MSCIQSLEPIMLLHGLHYYDRQRLISLPLLAVRVVANVKELAAEVKLTQTYGGTTLSRPIEAIYAFPIPAQATVHPTSFMDFIVGFPLCIDVGVFSPLCKNPIRDMAHPNPNARHLRALSHYIPVPAFPAIPPLLSRYWLVEDGRSWAKRVGKIAYLGQRVGKAFHMAAPTPLCKRLHGPGARPASPPPPPCVLRRLLGMHPPTHSCALARLPLALIPSGSIESSAGPVFTALCGT
ncbi:hypothetical protein B0H13DRAFT_2350826 [Mycena leptocephala]|nr:hypothetical protein B0H13DRAFT_2350826 [Mycena leptocephala]